MKAPCYKCPDRHSECHVACNRYKEFREKMNYIAAQRDKERPAIDYRIGKEHFMSMIRRKGERNRGRINVND